MAIFGDMLEHQDKKVNSYIKSGFVWNSVNRIGTLGVQFFLLLVLSRLLSKEDFALMGIVSFFNIISNILIDSGMGGYLVGAKHVDKKDFSTLFLYNFIVSVGLCILLIILSPVFSNFYNASDLKLILHVVGISIVITSLGKIQNVILIRELKFKILSYVSLISSVLSATIAIIMAILNCGIWSLVMQNVIFNLSTVILQFKYNQFIPQLVFSKKSFKRQWSFSVHLFFSQSIQTIYNNIYLTIFPKISSLSFAGLYTQASKLQQLPIGIFMAILDGATFPILSKIEDQNQFKKTNRSIISNFYIITFSLFLFLSLTARPLIAILLGKEWIDAAPILSILSFSGVFFMIMTISRNTLKSMNKTHVISRLEIYKTIIGIIILVITLGSGNYAIIWGILVSSFLSSIITLFVLDQNTNYSIKEQLDDIVSPLFILLPSYVITFFILRFIELDNNILLFIIGATLFSIIVIVLGFITKNVVLCKFYLRCFYYIKNILRMRR